MLPLVSLVALTTSFTLSSAHDLFSRDDTCSCVNPAASSFANSDAVKNAANQATTPSGYINTGTNGQAWTPGQGSLGFVDVDNYDSSICGGLCDTIKECSSFQIYFEPGKDGQSQVKCAFWGGIVDSSNANYNISNAIAGINTYTSSSVVPPSGYDAPTWYGNSAFDYNSPDVSGLYIGSQVFSDGSYDTARCADKVKALGGSFYNTYLLHDDSGSAQHCDVYSGEVPSGASTWSGKPGPQGDSSISNSFACGKSDDKNGSNDSDKPSSGGSWYNWAPAGSSKSVVASGKPTAKPSGKPTGGELPFSFSKTSTTTSTDSSTGVISGTSTTTHGHGSGHPTGGPSFPHSSHTPTFSHPAGPFSSDPVASSVLSSNVLSSSESTTTSTALTGSADVTSTSIADSTVSSSSSQPTSSGSAKFYIKVSNSGLDKRSDSYIGFVAGSDEASVVTENPASFHFDDGKYLRTDDAYIATDPTTDNAVFKKTSTKPAAVPNFDLSEEGVLSLSGAGYCTTASKVYITYGSAPAQCNAVTFAVSNGKPSTTGPSSVPHGSVSTGPTGPTSSGVSSSVSLGAPVSTIAGGSPTAPAGSSTTSSSVSTVAGPSGTSPASNSGSSPSGSSAVSSGSSSPATGSPVASSGSTNPNFPPASSHGPSSFSIPSGFPFPSGPHTSIVGPPFQSSSSPSSVIPSSQSPAASSSSAASTTSTAFSTDDEPVTVTPTIISISSDPATVTPTVVSSDEPTTVTPTIISSDEPVTVTPTVISSDEPVTVTPTIITEQTSTDPSTSSPSSTFTTAVETDPSETSEPTSSAMVDPTTSGPITDISATQSVSIPASSAQPSGGDPSSGEPSGGFGSSAGFPFSMPSMPSGFNFPFSNPFGNFGSGFAGAPATSAPASQSLGQPAVASSTSATTTSASSSSITDQASISTTVASVVSTTSASSSTVTDQASTSTTSVDSVVSTTPSSAPASSSDAGSPASSPATSPYSSFHFGFSFFSFKRDTGMKYMKIVGTTLILVDNQADSSSFIITSDGYLTAENLYIGVLDGSQSALKVFTMDQCDTAICTEWSAASGAITFANDAFATGYAQFYVGDNDVVTPVKGKAVPDGYKPASAVAASPTSATSTTASDSTVAATTSAPIATSSSTVIDPASSTTIGTVASTSASLTSALSTTATSSVITSVSTSSSSSVGPTTISVVSLNTTMASSSVSSSTSASVSTDSTSATSTVVASSSSSTTASAASSTVSSVVSSVSSSVTVAPNTTTSAVVSATLSAAATTNSTTAGSATSTAAAGSVSPSAGNATAPATNGTVPGAPGAGAASGNGTSPFASGNGTDPFAGGNGTASFGSFPGANGTNSTGQEWTTWDLNATSAMIDAYKAADVINSMNLTGFCSTLLGYTTPVVTATVTATASISQTSTLTAGTLTSGTTDTYTTLPTTITITQADSNWQRIKKRQSQAAIVTPAPLATYSPDTVSTACGWMAQPVNVTSTVFATTTTSSTTTVVATVPETTIPATTEIVTAWSTATINTCEPTAPVQLIKNPSFECYKAGWDLDYTGATLYWGPEGVAESEVDSTAQSYIDTVASSQTGSATDGSSDGSSDAGAASQSGSPYAGAGAASQGGSPFAGASQGAAGGAPSSRLKARTTRRMRRQDDSDSTNPDAYALWTPQEPAYDGTTYVRLSPAWGDGQSAGLGQNIDNLAAGNYWMAYKYRVPTYALNSASCALTVYINGITVVGPSTPDVGMESDGWQRAGGFFTVTPDLAGPSYLWVDFYCPPIGMNKRQDPNAAAGGSADASAGGSQANSYEPSSLPSAADWVAPDPTIPLVDLDYIRMGVDDGGWSQYRGGAPDEGDADAATVAADVANSPAVAAQNVNTDVPNFGQDSSDAGSDSQGASSAQ